MFYQAEIVLKNYIPDTIAPGIFFIVRDETGESKHPLRLWQIPEDGISQEEYDSAHDFLDKNGYPIHLFIIDSIDHSILASQEQIGWFDEGEESDEYRDITLKDINNIFGEHEGLIEIEIDEKDDIVNVILEENKVIIRLLQ